MRGVKLLLLSGNDYYGSVKNISTFSNLGYRVRFCMYFKHT